MPHKLDRKRHRRDARNRRREISRRYLKLTGGDSIDPAGAESLVKDADTLSLIRRLGRQLGARGHHVRFSSQA